MSKEKPCFYCGEKHRKRAAAYRCYIRHEKKPKYNLKSLNRNDGKAWSIKDYEKHERSLK